MHHSLASALQEPVALPERGFDGRCVCCSHLQERKFQGGSGQISECMAAELGELVKMKSPVYRIDQTGDLVVAETLDKQTYKVSVQEDTTGSRLGFPRRYWRWRKKLDL